MIRPAHLIAALGLLTLSTVGFAAGPPNIVIIYADDLGFGDVSCNGAKAGLTPNIDRLAKQGLNFTDAHTTSATCTPSRYALLTGEYPWRKRGTGVLPGDARLIIEPGRTTLASVLKRAGYRTGVVGKWHLGLGRRVARLERRDQAGAARARVRRELHHGGDRRPRPLRLRQGPSRRRARPGRSDRSPLRQAHRRRADRQGPIPELLRLHPSHGHDMAIVDGISRIGYMKGGKSALWKDETMADTFTREAVAFIKRHKARPFFLYFATHDIHVPRVPHPRFAGKSGMGPRGDAIVEFDWSVGEVLRALDENGLADEHAGRSHQRQRPGRRRRLSRRRRREAGRPQARRPLSRRQVQQVRRRHPRPLHRPLAGRASSRGRRRRCSARSISSRAFAALAGASDRVATVPDSRNHLPALLGEDPVGRETLIEHAGGLAVRRGKWKFIPASNGPRKNVPTNSELGNDPRAPALRPRRRPRRDSQRRRGAPRDRRSAPQRPGPTVIPRLGIEVGS